MRLIGAVKKLEAAGAARASAKGGPVGICWSQHEARVSACDLAPDEFIAVDVTVVDPGDGQMPPRWAIRERVTKNPQDLGYMFDAEGVRIGLVMLMQSDLIRYELADGRAVELLRGSTGE